MASTLGVLDVLSQLREESERASAALTAQEVGKLNKSFYDVFVRIIWRNNAFGETTERPGFNYFEL